MTELAVPERATVATSDAPTQQITTKSALVLWAEEARVVANIAVSIAKTPFAGQLRGKPEEVTAVILAGNEIGLPPMASLKAFDIIQGTPALRAHAMRGLLQSKGHEIELVKSTPELCVMRGRRKGAEAWQEVAWNLQRAAQMGLTQKAEWKKQPQTMLVARATGEISRLIASDVLHAVPYTSEELRDSDGTTYEARPAAPRLSIATITASPVPPAPTVDATAEPEDDEAENGDTGWVTEPGAAWPETAQIPA